VNWRAAEGDESVSIRVEGYTERGVRMSTLSKDALAMVIAISAFGSPTVGTAAFAMAAKVVSAAPTAADVPKHASAPPSHPETVSSVDPVPATVPDEERDFQNADKVGSLEGWRSFLSAHPSGVFAQLAKLEMERLAVEKAAAPAGTKISNIASAEDTAGGKGTTASPTLAEVASATSTVANVSKHASAPTANPETVRSVDPAHATVPDEERDFQNAGVVESYEHAVMAYNVGEFAEAKRLWLPLAERGDAPAQLGLAVMYFLGQGVQRNMAAALDWCQKAADQGLATAQYELGQFYEHPWRPELQNYSEAAKWYRKAADQNYARAQDQLGAMYEFGLGVPRDYTKAEEWFAKAGDLASVANMYDAVAHDPGKAANWKRKLADQGNKPAKSDLGEMYGNSKRARQDLLPRRCPEDGRECEKTGRRMDAIDLQAAKQGS
jgi:TPR repeat protein